MIVYIIMILITLLSLLKLENQRKTTFFRFYLSLALIVASGFMIDFNQISVDVIRYFQSLENIRNTDLVSTFKVLRYEYGFSFYLWVLSHFVGSIKAFLIINFGLIITLVLLAVKKYIKSFNLVVLVFSFLSLFYFINFTTNIIRQGFAFSILMFSAVSLFEAKYYKSLLFFIVACFFHISAIIFLPFYIVRSFRIKQKTLIVVYAVSVIFALLGINKFVIDFYPQNLGLLSKLFNRYASDGFIGLYGASTRLDFLLFNTVWVIVALLLNRFYTTSFYDWIIKLFLTYSIIFSLTSFISFSDRVAGYSWGLIPLLITIPLTSNVLKNKSLFSLAIIAIAIIMAFFFDVFSYY